MSDPGDELPTTEEPLIVAPPPAVDQEDAFLITSSEFVQTLDTEHSGAGVAPEAASTPAPMDFSPIVSGLSEISQRLDSLKTQFDREIRAEATREKVVDRLHAELQEYKGDMLLNILRPIFVDLIQLHDDIGKTVASVAETEALRLVAIQQGLEDILYRQGVEPFSVEGGTFDPRRQRAVSTVATEEASLARLVASRLRKGFTSGEKVIRPEIVTVYTLRKPTPSDQP